MNALKIIFKNQITFELAKMSKALMRGDGRDVGGIYFGFWFWSAPQRTSLSIDKLKYRSCSFYTDA